MVSSSAESESGLSKSKTLKATEKLLGEKLEKEIKKAILDVMKIDVESQPESVAIDQDMLYQLLDSLQFLNTKLSKDFETSNALV
jgi:uncharacterized protein YaaW (UPF0174 family)